MGSVSGSMAAKTNATETGNVTGQVTSPESQILNPGSLGFTVAGNSGQTGTTLSLSGVNIGVSGADLKSLMDTMEAGQTARLQTETQLVSNLSGSLAAGYQNALGQVATAQTGLPTDWQRYIPAGLAVIALWIWLGHRRKPA